MLSSYLRAGRPVSFSGCCSRSVACGLTAGSDPQANRLLEPRGFRWRAMAKGRVCREVKYGKSCQGNKCTCRRRRLLQRGVNEMRARSQAILASCDNNYCTEQTDIRPFYLIFHNPAISCEGPHCPRRAVSTDELIRGIIGRFDERKCQLFSSWKMRLRNRFLYRLKWRECLVRRVE